MGAVSYYYNHYEINNMNDMSPTKEDLSVLLGLSNCTRTEFDHIIGSFHCFNTFYFINTETLCIFP